MSKQRLENVEYMPAQQETEKSLLTKFKGKAVAVATGVTAFAVSAVSHAALDLSSVKAEVIGDIDSAESFGVEISLAILGFIAVLSVLRLSRGAVK